MTPDSASPIEVVDQSDNPIWRLQNLYLIKDKKARVSKLKLNRPQKILMSRIQDAILSGQPVRDNVLKYRQGGVSTFYLLLHLDRTIFTPNINSGILADLRENLGYLFEMVRFAHESMPDDLKPRLGSDSKSELSFPDVGSKMFVSLAIKSTTLHGLHVSEYAHMDQQDVERTVGACTPDAWVTSETTAMGRNFYWKTWLGWPKEKKIFLPWPLQDEYRVQGPPITRTLEEERLAARIKKRYGVEMDDDQFRYRRQKRADLKTLFDQEMAEDEETCFISTGGAFFNGKKIAVLIGDAEEVLKKEPIHKQTSDWTMWEPRHQGHIYAAGADVAEGGEGIDPDYSVLAIICATCRRTAFSFKARVGVDSFYRTCHEWGSYYNNALLGVESNNHGHAVIMGLREKGYKNLYVRNRKRGSDKPLVDLKFGWETNADTKPFMLDKLKLALEGKWDEDEDHFEPEITWLDTQLLNETLFVLEKDGKIGATGQNHDDMVMAYAIAVQMYWQVKPSMGGVTGIVLGDKTEAERTFKT